MSASTSLERFAEVLKPMLPADFALALAGLDLRRPRIDPGQLPVCRFWDQALAGGMPLLAPLADLAPHLRWVQTGGYVATPPSPGFLDNYGYAILAGPRGMVDSAELALGVLLLGPGTHYPSHHHPAVEIYVVISGTAEWQRGHEPWRREPPGRVIRHETMELHATRTLAEPLLAAYLWRGDLATDARIVAPSPGPDNPEP
jgi:hypothetical protein